MAQFNSCRFISQGLRIFNTITLDVELIKGYSLNEQKQGFVHDMSGGSSHLNRPTFGKNFPVTLPVILHPLKRQWRADQQRASFTSPPGVEMGEHLREVGQI